MKTISEIELKELREVYPDGMLTVELKHAPNPDIRGGYWSEPRDPRKCKKIKVASIREAVEVCRDYIARNDLGSGNWTGGTVTSGGKVIARISYNARVWDCENKEIKL